MLLHNLTQINRREFLAGLSVTVAVSSPLLSNPQNLVTPLTPSPQVEAFKAAQARLLAKFDYPTRPRFLKLAKPPLTLHVLEAGHGDPIVLLCGGPSVAALAPLLGPVSREFQTFAVDRPGCGLSDQMDYRGTPSREQAVNCLTGVLDELNLSKVAFVGNSMGGYLTLAFALARPERVSKLIFLGEVAGSSPPRPSVTTMPLPNTAYTASASLEDMRARYAARLVAHVDRIPLEFLEAMYAADHLPGSAQSTTTMLEQMSHEGFRLTYSLRPELKNLKPETLFIWGDQDKLGPPALGLEMAAIAPRAHCEVLKDAGHLPWLDQSEQCIRLTKDFLKRS